METSLPALFDLKVPFNRESWNGRIKACRGIGLQEKIEELEKEHRKLLLETVPEEFEIQHYAAMTVLRKNNYSFFRLRFEL